MHAGVAVAVVSLVEEEGRHMESVGKAGFRLGRSVAGSADQRCCTDVDAGSVGH